MNFFIFFLVGACFISVIGCAVNPVTGHRELSLIPTSVEIAIGEREYGSTQQLAGGLYHVDQGIADYVAEVGRRVAAVSDRHLPYGFVVVNDSTPNAWALPGGKIGIHRGLLVELENEAELAAVLGHEVVHAAAKHGANQLQRELLMGVVELGISHAVDDSKHAREIVGVTNVGLYLASRKFSRDDERTSDYHGMKYMYAAGYDTAAAVSLQEKFVKLSEDRASDWSIGLFATHPPSRERVANNRSTLLEYPPGGDTGEERFRTHIQTLLEDRIAYDLADQARETARNNSSMALRLINEAIERQPRESLFYGIRGDVFANQGRHQDAVQSYAAAIDLNTRYFAHYLGRGLSFDEMGYFDRAKYDFRQSNHLFQTPIASYKLGFYALSEGNRDEAKRQFEFASQDSGELGRTALNNYVRLDIEDSPWEYVEIETLFEDGQVIVEVSNSSGYPIEDIVVQVRATINGNSVTRNLSLDQLDSGYYDILRSAIYYRSDDEVNVRTTVVHATPGW